MSIQTLNTEADYDAALARLAVLLDAANATAHDEELSALTALIEAYEEKHFPIPPISFVAAMWDQLDSETFADLADEPIDAPVKALLDAAQRDYNAHPDAGSPWSEVEARLRNPRRCKTSIFKTSSKASAKPVHICAETKKPQSASITSISSQ